MRIGSIYSEILPVTQLIRDVHISFIKYVESMLEESSNTVAAYWGNVMKTIEPTVVQIFHHIEAVIVSASKQIIRECFALPNFYKAEKKKNRKKHNTFMIILCNNLFIF